MGRLDSIKSRLGIRTSTNTTTTAPAAGDASGSASAGRSSTRDTGFLGGLGRSKKKKAETGDGGAPAMSEKARGKQAVRPRADSSALERPILHSGRTFGIGTTAHGVKGADDVSEVSVVLPDPKGEFSAKTDTIPLRNPRPVLEVSLEHLDALACAVATPPGKTENVGGIPGTNPYNFTNPVNKAEKLKGRSVTVMEMSTGRLMSGGYDGDRFSMQSISKPLIAAFAAKMMGLKE